MEVGGDQQPRKTDVTETEVVDAGYLKSKESVLEKPKTSRTILIGPCDAAVHADHIASMISVLLGPEASARKPIASIERVGTETFRVAMMRTRLADTIRVAMNGGVINGRAVSVLSEE